MNHRLLVRFARLEIVSLASAGIGAVSAEASRPNVVVVLVDDMGWSDIGCYGGEIPTPNIDALARDGLRFTQFYNTARCSPTRASLLTGLYPHQAGMGYLEGLVRAESLGTHGRLADRAVTLAEVLGDAGYFTAMAGKWHIGHNHGTPPWKRGFQRALNSPAGGIYFPDQKNNQGGKKLFLDGKPHAIDDPIFGEHWYSTQLFTDWSLKFIAEARAEKKPFFLYVATARRIFCSRLRRRRSPDSAANTGPVGTSSARRAMPDKKKWAWSIRPGRCRRGRTTCALGIPFPRKSRIASIT